MNTHLVQPRTIWAVVAMEAAFALPLISLPTQGDRLPGLAGPLLLLMLLPLGYVGVFYSRELRDPSTRLLAGIALTLLARLIVSVVPEQGAMVWLGRNVMPAVIGVGLWWRGGALCVVELTPAEVRTEFSVLAICLVALLALVRPFVLADPVLLGGSVGLFVVSGFAAITLARQDAAEVASDGLARPLALVVAVFPALASLALLSTLRPPILTAGWSLLARLIELLLTPIGWFFAWLGSLLPHGPAVVPPPLPRPAPPPMPDPAALAEAQDSLAWIGFVLVATLVLAAALALLLATRLLLENYIRDPEKRVGATAGPEMIAERSGTPAGDARDLLGWLMRWLRGVGRGTRRGSHVRRADGAAGVADAWLAYQRLLTWAEHQGLGRRPAETARQLQARLVERVPHAASAVDLVTTTFESHRYGGVPPSADRLRRVQDALRELVQSP